MSRRSRSQLVLSVALGVLAIVAVTSGSAATTKKPYTASFAPIPPASVPGGSAATITLTLTNLANPQTLGSANVTAPSSFTISGAAPSQYLDATQTFPTSLLKLRNLNIQPGGQRTISINVTTPCVAGDHLWSIRAKQSNDFSGPPGNDFTFEAQGSNLVTRVTGCYELRFVTQPSKTVVGATITDRDYSSGGPIEVGLFDTTTDQPLTTCPVASCDVTITKDPADGTLGGDVTEPLTGNPFVATFDDLSINELASSALPKSFTLTASGVGPSDTSDAFAVIDGTNCVSQDPCFIGPFTTGSTSSSGQANGGNFVFVAFESLNLGYVPAGCAGFDSVGAAPLFIVEQRSALSGELYVTYGIKKSLIQKKYGNNSGQQFIPICAGAKRIRLNEAGRSEAVECDEDYAAGVPQATTANPQSTGWFGKQLFTSGANKGKFTGQLSQAMCDPQSGFFFGILGSFQDYTNSDRSLIIDPSTSPTVVEWTSDTTYRYFRSRWPSTSGAGVFATVPWDGWKFG